MKRIVLVIVLVGFALILSTCPGCGDHSCDYASQFQGVNNLERLWDQKYITSCDLDDNGIVTRDERQEVFAKWVKENNITVYKGYFIDHNNNRMTVCDVANKVRPGSCTCRLSRS